MRFSHRTAHRIAMRHRIASHRALQKRDSCPARAQTAIATPQLSVLVDALTAANLTGGSLADPFAVQTVFAPTNAAFAKLTAALGTTVSQLFTRKARGGVAARAQAACARADQMRCAVVLACAGFAHDGAQIPRGARRGAARQRAEQ
jgi:hypothetical protein